MPVPLTITFELKPISSRLVKCFFCREKNCDQVFVAKCKDASKIRAFAVHDQCVFDHMELQGLASKDS